ncbi:MAG TPA: hypothetical protein VN461_05530 [Vicinamibacteria bacterium]|jgi:photosystem II stability/assembly factor-like uncharacterized protein|nr:hypothetical protein [Vicinamibacteria bacterium]
MRHLLVPVCALCLGAALGQTLPAEPLPPAVFSDLRWRNIGPFRGGWSTCVEGVPGRPDVFYFGAAVGGVWESDDAGRTWEPLFQNEASASVGALAIAPSNPRILYVGTGQTDTRYDIASGRGIYRSDDGGKTWQPRGLADTRAIGRIVVDPRSPDVVLVAALGHIFGPNPERGVFRSEDGGKTWQRVLFVDENTGAVDLAADPTDPSVVYAATWQVRNYPWLSYFHAERGPGSGVFKSADGGKTWRRLSGGEWPTEPLGRIGLAAAAGGRIYAVVVMRTRAGTLLHAGETNAGGGLYRSDDGGTTWKRVSQADWLESDYFARLTVDPSNPDRIYAMGRSVRRSDDGGRTFQIVKGAPGGDDYHYLWINPKQADHMAVASDQGTSVSVNGGRTWSTWYNQPTGQFYHLATDERFPYWIYSGQQDSGTVGIASRSEYGALSYREWHPVGGEERGYEIPDPGDPETVYGSGLGGDLTRFDARTGQVAAISPHLESTYGRRPTDVKYRYTWIAPLAVSPRPPYALFAASQYLWRSADRGHSWAMMSPDLTGAVPDAKGCGGEIGLGNARPCGFGVIFTIALSPSGDDEIWIGTDDGRIQTTRDGGKSWSDVTPGGLSPWSKVSTLDIPPFDAGTVYAAIDRQRLDDFTPHVYRTHDRGRTWTEIGAGLPKDSVVSVVRADPVRRGLLYAGTDTGVFVSFTDGEGWQPLQLNLPTTWVRDLLVHGNDLIAATQGRALWILDDVAPLRQVTPETASKGALLFPPADAWRRRRSQSRDTPLPPETPLGKNPPEGAVLDYFLGASARGPVTIEIIDAKGNPIRRFSSEDSPPQLNAVPYFVEGWLKPEATPAASAGHHRFLWDLRYPRPRAARYEYSIGAIWGEGIPLQPEGALAMPGQYSVRLSVDGQSFTQPLTLRIDPRVRVTPEAIAEQFGAARRACSLLDRSSAALEETRAFRKRLLAAGRRPPATSLEKEAAELEEGEGGFARLSARLDAVWQAIDSSDGAPTAQAMIELDAAGKDFDALLVRQRKLGSVDDRSR